MEIGSSKDQIVEALCRPDTILFVGSGVSRWSGLPSWQGLISSLCEYCTNQGEDPETIRSAKAALRKARFEEAAGLLHNSLPPEKLGEFFRTDNCYSTAVPHNIHEKLLALGPRSYITVNYDPLIEKAAEQSETTSDLRTVTNDDIRALAGIAKSSAIDFVYKVHGDISKPETIILTTQHYNHLINDQKAVKSTLQNLFVSRAVVMIGVGLKDRDIDLILGEIKSTYKGNIEDIFAISHDHNQKTIDLLKDTQGITVLSYDTKNSEEGHSELLQLLDELVERTNQRRLENRKKASDGLVKPRDRKENTTEVDRRLLKILETDGVLRKMILSALYWSGPTDLNNLVGKLKLLGAEASSAITKNNVERLISEGILMFVGALIFPRDQELVEAVGIDRIDDAECFVRT